MRETAQQWSEEDQENLAQKHQHLKILALVLAINLQS